MQKKKHTNAAISHRQPRQNQSDSIKTTTDANGFTVVHLEKSVIPKRTGDKEKDLARAFEELTETLKKASRIFTTQ